MCIEKQRTYAGAAIMDNSMKGPQKLKNAMAICSSSRLLGIYLEEWKSGSHRSNIHSSKDMGAS